MIDENENEIKELIEHFIPVDITNSGDKFIIKSRTQNGDNNTWEIDKEKLENIYVELNSKNYKEATIYDKKSYETLLNPLNSRYFHPRLMDKSISKVDNENNITYEISGASDHFVFYIIKQLKDLNDTMNNYMKMNFNIRFRRLLDEKQSFLEIFKKTTQFQTLKISSSEDKTLKLYENLGTSFLFTLSYNIGTPIIEMKSLNELSRTRKLYGTKRNKIEEINPPHKIYISDLVYHYQTALSSETASLKFLSYYHIMEYFFEKVYNEDLLKIVKEKLISPGFSYKNDKEINNLINTIQKKTKMRSDTSTFNEKEALKLVLKKYVSLDQLKDSLNDYDSSLIESYKTKEVSFSHGDKIDFNSDEETVYKNISNRIYKTRNSIVHRKEGDKPQYIPYKNEKQLLNEIPLMNILSEEVIIQSATIFDPQLS